MCFHEGQHISERTLLHDGVGIQQQHVFALCLADGKIISPCKTLVLLILHQFHPGVIALHHLHAVVRRVIVHHKHLTLDTLEGSLYALQTLLQIAAYIIADNHHAQLHALSSSVVSAIQRD